MKEQGSQREENKKRLGKPESTKEETKSKAKSLAIEIHPWSNVSYRNHHHRRRTPQHKSPHIHIHSTTRHPKERRRQHHSTPIPVHRYPKRYRTEKNIDREKRIQ
jgi:hypothetical protein